VQGLVGSGHTVGWRNGGKELPCDLRISRRPSTRRFFLGFVAAVSLSHRLDESPYKVSERAPPLGSVWPFGQGMSASDSPTMRTSPRRAQTTTSPSLNVGVV